VPFGKLLDERSFPDSRLATNKYDASVPCGYSLEYDLQLIKELSAFK
jgi:hypothetical protein